jgi:hypothetical protein
LCEIAVFGGLEGNMQFKRLMAKFILALFLAVLSINAVCACFAVAADADKPRVIMVVVDRVSISDITDVRYRNIQNLLAKGAFGLMTINSGGDITDINSYLSLGGGDKFAAPGLACESYNRNEIIADGAKAFQAYERNTGKSSGDSQVLNIGIAAVLKTNQSKRSASYPGQLGSLLHQSGLKAAVIGNSDLGPEESPNRLAALIAMDEDGKVDEGNISRDMLKNDAKSPYGWRTDYDKINEEIQRVWNSTDLIVVETGDTIRANDSSGQQVKKMVEYHRQRAISQVDTFIGQLLPRISKDTMLLVVTPLPESQSLRDGMRVAPVFAAGGNILPGSILISPSTRQKGIVANFDFPATVLGYLKANQGEGISGLPIQSVIAEKEQPVAYVSDLARVMTVNSLQRAGVMLYFTKYLWIIYVVMLVIAGFRWYQKNRLLRAALIAVLVYPLAILLLPLIGSLNPSLTIFLSLAIVVVLAYLLNLITDDIKMLAVAAVVNVVTSVADVLTGATLAQKAALSYDMVVGGRYYGIGNEYMGVVIGAAILGAVVLLQLKPDFKRSLLPLICLFFAGLIVFFAAPSAGANAGGVLAGIVGCTATIYGILRGRLTLRSVIIIIVALAAGFGILLVINNNFSFGASSHVGRAIDNLATGKLVVVWQTIARKAAANFFLLQHSPFSTILLLQLILGLGVYFRNRRRVKDLYEKMPYVKAGLSGIFVGALAAFAFEDSGVIAAVLMLNYLFAPLVLLMGTIIPVAEVELQPVNRG